MRKLFAANNRYLLKNKLFWIELLFCAVFSAWIMFANYSPKIQASEDPFYLENSFFNMYQIFSVVFAAAISLIVGTEYSDGTIRNKLVSGHTRTEIYFSILLTNLLASLAVIAAHGVISYGIGYFLFGTFHISAAQLGIALFCAILANLVFTALFVAIALNCSNKSITAVISLLASMAIILLGNFAGNRLLEPEMTYDGITITANGIQYGDMIQNPNYVSGTTRAIYELIYNLLPSGQLIQIQSLKLNSWTQWVLFSCLLFLVVTGIGYRLFAKKDIK